MTQPPQPPDAPGPTRGGQPAGPPPSFGPPTSPPPGAPPTSPPPAGPPPSAPPSTPPASPYGQPSPAPHAAPPPNPYAHPYGVPPTAPSGVPPYGAPAPYGAFPGGPGQPPPSKAFAVTALVLAFLAWTGVLGIVSLVLAVLVLRRARDGRDHGQGLAIAAIVVDVVMMLAAAGLAAALVFAGTTGDVNDLETRDCFDAPGITDDDAFRGVETVDCADPHDAEVLATVTLDADEAERYGEDNDYGGLLCNVATEAWRPEPGTDVQAMYITDEAKPDEGDVLACVVTAPEGEKLTGRVD